MKNLIGLIFISFFYLACYEPTDTGDTESNIGKAGSTSKFTIVENHLYVAERNSLKTFNISEQDGLVLIDTVNIDSDELETIYPYTYEGETTLLLGAQSGMHIYKLDDQGIPNNSEQIVLTHSRACDPVIANDGIAYVTLHTTYEGGWCYEGVNQLQVIDISDINLPVRLATIELQGPKGLSFSQDNQTLFVCDKYKLIQFSLADPTMPVSEKDYPTVSCNDILQYGDHYIVTGPGLLKVFAFNTETRTLEFDIDLLAE